MYQLLPNTYTPTILALVVLAVLFTQDFGLWIGIQITDSQLIRLLPAGLVLLAGALLAPTGRWAPWRLLWRVFPALNKVFPDLNGVWVGSTHSNWPTIQKLIECTQSEQQLSEQELFDIAEQCDAIALRITCSIYSVQIEACLSSTEARSHSIVAKPWKQQHTGRVHLSYVYEQETPHHEVTDEEKHLGAAELVFPTEQYANAEGTYWTRRGWKTGRNTAGLLVLRRLTSAEEEKKPLRHHAEAHKAQMEAP